MIPCWRTKIPHTTRVQPKIKNLITGVEIKNVKQFLTVMIVLKVGTKWHSHLETSWVVLFKVCPVSLSG